MRDGAVERAIFHVPLAAFETILPIHEATFGPNLPFSSIESFLSDISRSSISLSFYTQIP